MKPQCWAHRGRGVLRTKALGSVPFPSQPQSCCPQGAGRQQSLRAKLLVLRAAPHLLITHLLFFGWYPQKEMFFSWKKWLHLFTWGRERERQTVKAFLPTTLRGNQALAPGNMRLD